MCVCVCVCVCVNTNLLFRLLKIIFTTNRFELVFSYHY